MTTPIAGPPFGKSSLPKEMSVIAALEASKTQTDRRRAYVAPIEAAKAPMRVSRHKK
jgi:hypothetical protein